MKQPSNDERAQIMVGAKKGNLVNTTRRMNEIAKVKNPKHRAFMLAQEIASHYDITPLDYMLGLVNNEDVPRDVRLDAAKAAAPFVHKRQALQVDMDMTSKSVSVGITSEDIKNLSDDEVDTMLAVFSKMASTNITTIDVDDFNIVDVKQEDE